MPRWKAGRKNGLTDLKGVHVGNASDDRLKSGATVVLFDQPATASVLVLGGAPGTRDTELLHPENTVAGVDALVLSGGSAFGLDAASGVQAYLREMGRGFEVGGFRVPIVPSAILFDLANGGDKDWGTHSPYRDLGYRAAKTAIDEFEIGTAGAGAGATTALCKGGLGTASTVLANGITVAALVAVNAVGSPLVGATRHFWAASFEQGNEFGGLGLPHPLPIDVRTPRTKFDPQLRENTTIAVIATDAVLTKAEAKRLAMAAHDGFTHALYPAHTDFDGDLVFAASTGASDRIPSALERLELAAAATATMARAIARGVFAAASQAGDLRPAWRDLD